MTPRAKTRTNVGDLFDDDGKLRMEPGDRGGTSLLAQAISADFGDLTLRQGKPSYNPEDKVMKLPAFYGGKPPEEMRRYIVSMIAHESGERAYRKTDPTTLTPGMRALINAVGDAWINAKVSEDYPGAGRYLQRVGEEMKRAIVEKNNEEPFDPNNMTRALAAGMIADGDFDVDAAKEAFPQIDEDLERGREVLETLPDVVDPDNPESAINEACERLYSLIFDEEEDRKKEEARAKVPAGGDGDDIPPASKNEALEERIINRMDYSGSGTADQYTFNPEKDKIWKPTSGGIGPLPPSEYEHDADMVAQAIRDALHIVTPRYRRRQDRGRIDPRRLAHLCMVEPDVFKRRLPQPDDDTSVFIMVDESGSMHGSRIQLAQHMAYVLNRALGQLEVPTAIAGHHAKGKAPGDPYRRERLKIRIYKDFSEQYNSDEVLTRLGRMKAGGNNVDPEAVAFAGKALARRKERRKILFYVADGMPAFARNGPNRTALEYYHKVLEDIRGAGIEVICLAVDCDLDQVERDFDTYARFDSSDGTQIGMAGGRMIADVMREEKIKAARIAARQR